MNVLFLDIDGVCNSLKTYKRRPAAVGIDPDLAALVQLIIQETGVSVVLSSTWRKWEEGREEVRRQIVPFIDVTPDHFATTGEPAKRGEEIADWLNAHPEVERYAILDDDSDMLPEQLPNFFKTSVKEGLTEEIAAKVIAHFL